MSSSLLAVMLGLQLLVLSAPMPVSSQHRHLANETDAELLIGALLNTPFKKHDLMPGVTDVLPGKLSESPFPPLDDSWLRGNAAVGWIAFGVAVDAGFALGPIQYGVFSTVGDAELAFAAISQYLVQQDNTRVFHGSMGSTLDWITHNRFTIDGGALAQIDNVLVLSGVALMRGMGPYDKPTTVSRNPSELFAIQETGLTHLYAAYASLEQAAGPSDAGTDVSSDGVTISPSPIIADIGGEFSVNVTLSTSGDAETSALVILLSPELQLLRDPECDAGRSDGCRGLEMTVLPQLDGSTAIDITGSYGGPGQLQIIMDLVLTRQALPGNRVAVSSYFTLTYPDGRTEKTDTWTEVQYD